MANKLNAIISKYIFFIGSHLSNEFVPYIKILATKFKNKLKNSGAVLFSTRSYDPVDLGGIGLINFKFCRDQLAIYAVVDI